MLDQELIDFVADGSVLHRQSGVDDRPLKSSQATPFRSPGTLAVTLEAPNRGSVRGMGIARGITLIVGGGFHGKSTLLNAIELGVWNHRHGDGREFALSDPDTVKLRA